jgi:CcmD family protein
MMKRHVSLALFLLTLAVPALARTPSQTLPQASLQVSPQASQPAPSKPSAQDEFVPVNAPMNPQDTIPAPRLVAIAYGFIWVVLFGYLWSVRSRLSTVEREIETVSRRLPGGK